MHTLAGGDLKDVYVDGISPWGFTNCVKRKSATNPDSYAFLETMIEQIISCGLAPDEGKREVPPFLTFQHRSSANEVDRR